ncbi:MAG: hypothetical protein EOP43_06575 [Sphingobacteriaceae bacterium]|nr:MAG: hypothetical protein EOP43_06575 [Sphingobacteriaceae bacterium]
MIQTVTVDIINDKALKLLEDLELLQLIRLHKENTEQKVIDWTIKYKGSLSKQPIADVDTQLNELRNGWE